MRILIALGLALPLLAQDGAASAPAPARTAIPDYPLGDLLNRHEVLGYGPEALAERARLHFLAGNTPKGEELLKLALEKAGANGEVYRLAALALFTAGQPARALALHQELLQRAPKADDALAHAAGDLVQAGFPDQADALMERAYQLDPRDMDETLAFAVIASEAGHSALATKWLTKLRGLDKSDAKQEAMPLLQAFLAAGKVGESAALADKILAARPRDWEVAIAVAKVALRQGQPELAKAWMRRAELIDAREPHLLMALALLARGLDQTYRH